MSDPPELGGGSTPPRPRGSLTPRVSVSMSSSGLRRTLDRNPHQNARRARVRCVRHHPTSHVPKRVAQPVSGLGDGAPLNGRLADNCEGHLQGGCAVAPTSILRERSAASRLRSLRSPLRGLDPAVAFPFGLAFVGATAFGVDRAVLLLNKPPSLFTSGRLASNDGRAASASLGEVAGAGFHGHPLPLHRHLQAVPATPLEPVGGQLRRQRRGNPSSALFKGGIMSAGDTVSRRCRRSPRPALR